MIIDIDLNTLRQLRKDTHRFFFIERDDTIEIYSILNNILFRYIYTKKGDENDLLFFDNTLKNALKIKNISFINEDKWQRWAVMILEEIRNLKVMLDEKLDRQVQ